MIYGYFMNITVPDCHHILLVHCM